LGGRGDGEGSGIEKAAAGRVGWDAIVEQVHVADRLAPDLERCPVGRASGGSRERAVSGVAVGDEATRRDAEKFGEQGEHRSTVAFTVRESEFAEGVVLLVGTGLVHVSGVQVGRSTKLPVRASDLARRAMVKSLKALTWNLEMQGGYRSSEAEQEYCSESTRSLAALRLKTHWWNGDWIG